jgi:hypothetical protein
VALAGVTITICAIALGALLGAGAHSSGLRPHPARNETAAAVPPARLPAHPAARLVSNPPPHHAAPTPTASAVAAAPEAPTPTSSAVVAAPEAPTPTSSAVAAAPEAPTPTSSAVAAAPEAPTPTSSAVAAAPEAPTPTSSAVAAAPEAQGQGSSAVAAELEAQGHGLVQAGSYAEAVTVLRRAVSATGERLSECLQPATPTCLTYAYALYDLGQALRLEGQPAAAVSILQSRLEINNQRSTVQAELQLARQTTG